MPRQRIRLRRSRTGAVGLVLSALLGAALIWYGLMVLLLAFGTDPGFVDQISGYRTAFDYLAGLTPTDIDSTTRAIVAGAGLLCFLIFGYLAYRSLPRSYLARHAVELEGSEHGTLTVEAGALERLAEVSSCGHPAVASARGRTTEERIELDLTLLRMDRVGADLAEVRERVREALAEHGLPARPVDLTLTDFQSKQRRELL